MVNFTYINFQNIFSNIDGQCCAAIIGPVMVTCNCQTYSACL